LSKHKIHKGKIFVFVLVFVIAIVCGFAIKTSFFSNLLDKKIVKYETDIQLLKKDAYPVHFVINKKTDNANDGVQTISGRFAFYTPDDKMIGEPYSFNIQGNELFFDFVVVSFGTNTKLVFPNSIFSDTTAPDKGTFIATLYDVNGYPAILDTTQIPKVNEQIRTLYKDICAKKTLKNAYGNAVHDTTKLGSFVEGQEYLILVHPKGGIEIITDK
jgi:hypothetical protein